MKVVWSREAQHCLRRIYWGIAEDSPKSASKVIARLVARAALLSQPPLVSRVVPEYRLDALREVLTRPYRILFVVEVNAVRIVSVMHSRQLLPGVAAGLLAPPPPKFRN